MKEINELYFEMLCQKAKLEQSKPIPMHEPEKEIHSGIIPYSIIEDEDLKEIHVTHYKDLSDPLNFTKNYKLNIIKMQAGLGTSVERIDLIKEVESRTTLGAKGTDLYFDVLGKKRSIAEIQLLQAYKISESEKFKEVIYQGLVNDETISAVAKTWNFINPLTEKSYEELFEEASFLSKREDLFQKKMPTFTQTGELTTQRLAPAGHGFIGVLKLLDIFQNDTDELIVIGNGEDLNSTPDLKILDWVAKENIPAVMITTTKTINDKKGGQISIVKGDHPTYVSIIEKAQAQMTNQLGYFEQLGLRENDRIGLFNTNIVVINSKALKEIFNKTIKDQSIDDFLKNIAPDVIRNIKEQDGKKFTQLESALGSVMLNLDKYMRVNHNERIVSFLNLAESEREKFFMPIKKRSDYDEILEKFMVNEELFRVVTK